MEIFTTRKATQAFLQNCRKSGKTSGFVPTMGALHEGHLELMRRARDENDIVVVSIFVNPRQFNDKEDLGKYPREVEKDIEKLKEIPVDVLFNPPVKEMYPDDVTESYNFGRLENVMEGKHRPGHFNEVAIVVKRLFDIIHPHRAYFGEKDYQQLRIIQELVKKESILVKIVPCPTIREPDGLAMSSRNKRLSERERKVAPVIYRALKGIKENAFKKPLSQLLDETRTVLNANEVFELEYLQVADAENLMPIEEWKPGNRYVACIAVHLGKVRLIDNVIIR